MKYFSSLKLKLIYVFRINDAEHKDCLKIGEATCDDGNVIGLAPNSKPLNEAARKRINQYTQTAGIRYELIYTELALYNRGGLRSFNDKEVHAVLERSGVKKKVFDKVNGANEWFITNLDVVKHAIAAVKEGKESLLPGERWRTGKALSFSVLSSGKPLTRPGISSRKATRCFGTPRCVSARLCLPCRWSRTWISGGRSS